MSLDLRTHTARNGVRALPQSTSRKRRVVALEGFGLEIVEHMPLCAGG